MRPLLTMWRFHTVLLYCIQLLPVIQMLHAHSQLRNLNTIWKRAIARTRTAFSSPCRTYQTSSGTCQKRVEAATASATADATACSSSSSPSSFDVPLIWQVKSALLLPPHHSALLSAPSAQWCKSHMLLSHAAVWMLLCSRVAPFTVLWSQFG